MFYHLKSTNDRVKTGDVMLKLSDVSGITIMKVTDDEETYFNMRIEMSNGEHWKANFNHESEALKVMQELTNNPCEDFVCCFRDTETLSAKKEALRTLLA